ncbi:MAG: MBL fold metallo-hydrolase [Opitutia bacterium]
MRLTDLNSGRDIGANSLLLEFGGHRMVVDCGMHPKHVGKAALPRLDLVAGKVDSIVLTHCHLDHLGSLPLLVRGNPRARVLTSAANTLFVQRLLRNSLSVMGRQKEEQGIAELPLYTHGDIERVEAALAAVPLDNPRLVGSGADEVELRFHRAGHVAGAVGFSATHQGRRVFVTGDVHFSAQRTIPGAEFPRTPADILVMECTRGATTTIPDASRGAEERRLLRAINRVVDGGGSVLIPAFAFGRMQELLVFLGEAADRGELADCPIFCSGLGLDLCDYLSEASRRTRQLSFDRRILDDLGIIALRKQYTDPGRKPREAGIYLLSSGMLVEKTPAWRLAANLLDHKDCAVFFVGYCDPDTPGGQLIGTPPDGEFEFKGLDHVARVRCEVERFHLSGHADREELIAFAKDVGPRDIVLTHGDPPARDWMRQALAEALPKTRVHDPVPGKPIDL